MKKHTLEVRQRNLLQADLLHEGSCVDNNSRTALERGFVAGVVRRRSSSSSSSCKAAAAAAAASSALRTPEATPVQQSGQGTTVIERGTNIVG